MNACYLCLEELSKNNSSREHILLNAIGGRLKSDKLLCKDCNSKFGHEADTELARQLLFLSSYLNIKREKGSNPIIKGAKSKDGKTYNLINGFTPVLSKPTIESKTKEGITNYTINARNEQDLINMLKRIQKKEPKFDIELAKKNAIRREEYLSEPISVDLNIGGDLAFKSLVKIAVNYYIFSRNEKDEVNHLFNYLKGLEELKIGKHYYPENSIYIQEEKEVIHLIHLVGDKNRNLLYAFIELFSSYSFIILLSTEYQGKEFASTYCYDVIENKKIEKKVSLNISKDEMDQIIMMTRNDFEIIQKKVSRVMKIGYDIQNRIGVNKLIGKTIESVFNKKYKGQTIVTEEMIRDFSSEIALAYVKFISRGKKNDHPDNINES